MKYLAIYGKREKYPIQTMCRFFGVSRSGYYDYIKRMNKPDRDETLAAKRSTAGGPTATDGCSYGLNSREFTVTLKPYCGSCGNMACCLRFAPGRSTGLWDSSFTAMKIC